LYQQVGDVRFGVAVKFVERDHDVSVGEVADATHLLMHRASSQTALVIQLYDVI
jgi:hypothetical protein